MALKIVELPESKPVHSVDSDYVHILHNGYELVITINEWKELQKDINEKIELNGKSHEC